jgi:hypothetical protein
MTETVTFQLSRRKEETWQAIDFYCLACGKNEVWIQPKKGTCLCLDCGALFDLHYITSVEMIGPDDKMRLMALRKANGRDIWANQNLK